MKLENTTKSTLIHEDIVLNAGEVKDIPQNIAKIWLKINGVKQYVNPVEVEKKEHQAAAKLQEAEKKIAELEKEIDKLTKENAKLQEAEKK